MKKNCFMLSMCISSYESTREVLTAHEKRKCDSSFLSNLGD